MLRTERQNQIVDLINKKGIATIEELMAEVAASKATIRRDVNDLADENRIIKVRGGAQAVNALPNEPSFNAKSLINAEEKQRIAREAVKHILPNDHIILDSGTTVLELAKCLHPFSDLTIVTNDIHIAGDINTNSTNTLIFIGGIIRKGYCSSYGYYAESMLKNISVDKIFLSVDAIDADLGITSYTMDDVNLKIIGMNNAKEVYLLCDHSKFTTHALFTVGLLDIISTIICGKELDDSIAQKFRDAGKKIILV